MLEPERLLASEPLVRQTPWTWRDVVLYHLGIGAGQSATDLDLLWEDNLHVLPTFAVVPGMVPITQVIEEIPGFAIDPTQLVHEHQKIVLPNGALPANCLDAVSTTTVTNITDRKVGASVTIATSTTSGDQVLCINEMTVFIAQEGGCGNHGDQTRERAARLSKTPSFTQTVQTQTNQAALYRLSGDENPLHISPAFAAQAGFDTPILHGLCTLGIAVKTVVANLNAQGELLANTNDNASDNPGNAGSCEAAFNLTRYSNAGLIQTIAARFSGPVIPGDTLEIAAEPRENTLLFGAYNEGKSVLKDGAITLSL